MRFRLLSSAVGVAMLSAFLLVSPALAKGTSEFIVSGGELDRPVFISSHDLASVRGWAFGGNDPARPERLGTKYDMDPIQFGTRPEGSAERAPRIFEGRWAYYPEARGAIDQEGRWIPFSPAFHRVVNQRIGQARGLDVRIGLPIVLMLVGIALAGGMLAGARLSFSASRRDSVAAQA